MKKTMALIAGMIFLTGCNESFRGQLELEKPIQFVNGLTKRDLSRLEKCDAKNLKTRRCKRLRKKREKATKEIAAGTHLAKVVPGRKSIKMQILDNRGKKVQEFSVKIPKGIKLPKTHGKVDIPSQLSGFPYDVEGELQTEITNSDMTSTWESCTWTESYRVCDVKWVKTPGCVPGTDNGERERKKRRGRECQHRERVCWTEYETFYGNHPVEYFIKHTERDLKFAMVKASTKSLVGDFAGKFNKSEKIYTYQGVCR